MRGANRMLRRSPQVAALSAERLDRSRESDAIVKRNHFEIERRLDAFDHAPDGRDANLERIDRRRVEGHGAGEDGGPDLCFRIGHRAFATALAPARFRTAISFAPMPHRYPQE